MSSLRASVNKGPKIGNKSLKSPHLMNLSRTLETEIYSEVFFISATW
jgi:hypothetical protein